MSTVAQNTNLNSSSYTSLLKTLSSNKDRAPSSKRRKISVPNAQTYSADATKVNSRDFNNGGHVRPIDGTRTDGEASENRQHSAVSASPADEVDSEEDEEKLLQDPFEKHYVNVIQEDISKAASTEEHTSNKPEQKTLTDDIKRIWYPTPSTAQQPDSVKRLQDLYLKRRLQISGDALLTSLPSLEKDVAGAVTNYHDVLFNSRTIENATRLRDICALHSLNHLFKTRDKVLKNNTKLSQNRDDESIDARDQGFTRPKVLVVLPTKQSCFRFVESMTQLSQPEQQENNTRFIETYSRDDGDEWQEKPEDFQELFGGNHEEDFRIGLKFTRKTIKFFSGFYNSDIIIGSPLGLMRTIASGGSKDDTNKSPDADFLSSIEVVVVDHTDALQMQNWQHVEYVFSHLNQLPKESHGCDFSRVRSWYLDGNAKLLRQTIIISSYLTPEINALASAHLHNIAGRVKYLPTYTGSMLEILKTLPLSITQTFIRFDSKTPASDSDFRFKYFNTTILPQLTRDKTSQGILIFIPTYADFVRLRNHLDATAESSSIPFGSVSEYTPVRDIARARSHFLSGRQRVLLYTERAHHHFRYRIKGVRKIIFYGVPENPVFWTEIMGLLGLNVEAIQSISKSGKGLVRALFSKWDVMKLERVVGTERVKRLVSEKLGDTFDFA